MEHNKSYELVQENQANSQKIFQIRLALLFHTRIIGYLDTKGVKTYQILNLLDSFSNNLELLHKSITELLLGEKRHDELIELLKINDTVAKLRYETLRLSELSKQSYDQ